MDIATLAARVADNVEHVIMGKRPEVERLLVAILCRGHVLIEDVPGVGKTTLAKGVARSLGCSFSRIQCTPDLLPSDITGISIFNQQSSTFEYRAGPIVAQIVLADEINRATPKTQSALLEAMEERQVTVDGVTRALPEPFIVLATQNPIEYEGTFPLPEAQLDRFLLRLRLGYPDAAAELAMVESQRGGHPIEQLAQVVSTAELIAAQKALQDVYVDPLIKQYVLDLVTATRAHPDIYLGASPRGTLALMRTSQATAAILGRAFVVPDDVKAMSAAVLGHRIIVSPSARIRHVEAEAIVAEIVGAATVPGAAVRARA
ncbi:MAG: AAA family ATPase [Ardenticatenales bacterium]|nr:AAA family ATPase [Ardenticatenales bacterium]